MSDDDPVRYRLAAVTAHPVQYQAPLFQCLARNPAVDLTVYYGNDGSVSGAVDREFGRSITWDRPVLDGYRHTFLTRVGEGLSGPSKTLRLSRIIGELWRGRYDAVFIHSYATPTSWLAYLGAWLSRTPVLLRTESELLRPRRRWVELAKQLALRGLFRTTAGFLAIGTANRSFYAHYGVPSERVFDTPYSVDSEFFTERAAALIPQKRRLKEELGFSADLPVVMFSGKLIELKRVGDLIAAFSQVRQGGLQAGLLIVGDGAMRPALEEQARSHGVGPIRFVGFKNQTELPRHYAAADLLVLPSRTETWGLVLNEAMIFGMPIITTDRVGAGLDLVVPGNTGFLYSVGDVQTLAGHLQALLERQDLRQRLGDEARMRVAWYSPATCTRGVLAALQHVCRSARHVPSAADSDLRA